ncbi:hypothetical protein FALCPG4_011535 [Fusarium falciforme]
MYYLDRTPLYEVEKPYSMRYLPEEGIPQTNYKKVKYPLTARSMQRPDAINIWKPIKGPLNNWPLGLCDTRSVDFEKDTIAGGIVFDDFYTENLQILHNPDFQWYYLPDQNTWEVLMFKSADSDKNSPTPGMPHSPRGQE